jgi:hypothetical protein
VNFTNIFGHVFEDPFGGQGTAEGALQDLGPDIDLIQKAKIWTFSPTYGWQGFTLYDVFVASGEHYIGELLVTLKAPVDAPHTSNGPLFPEIDDPQYYDPNGNPLLTISVPPTPVGGLDAAVKLGADWYAYQVSLLNGDDQISIRPGNQSSVEVGAGGVATIAGGSDAAAWIWHQKNVVWTTTGKGNALVFDAQAGSNIMTSGVLFLNLITGAGTNPWGGTLQVQGVDQIAVGNIGGEYIIANNDGDTINGGFGAFEFGGNALIVGGTGNDTLDGSNVGVFGGSVVNVIAAGVGTDTLSGGRNNFGDARTATNIFSYNFGVDAITNFRAGSGSGDMVDLSSVPGLTSFASVQAKMSQSGANTVINFGNGHTLTLDNVTEGNLTSGNFLLAPEAAFAFTQPGEADAGTTVQLFLAMTGAVAVNTTNGSPTLTLSDGATATYDAAASSAAGHVLVFDYAVGANDHSPDLAVVSVNANGAAIQDANGHSVSFSPVQNQTVSLEINRSPLNVASVTPSQSSGEKDTGTITFTLNMSESNFTIDTTDGTPSLTLNNGERATYAGVSGNQISFSYTIKSGDETPDLTVTGVQLGNTPGENAVVQDSNGYLADFSGAANFATGVQIGPTLYVTSVGNNAAANNPATGDPEADVGTAVELVLNMNEAVTVTGSPTLTLSDGATATYDASLSGPAEGGLVFDYTVGSGDHSPDLRITTVNGGSIADAGGHQANFTGISTLSSALQINPSPLTVTSLSPSTTGHVAVGATVLLTLHMSENVTVGSSPKLDLSDGETAFYDSAASSPSSGTLVFEYIVGNDLPDPNALNLEITGIDLGQDIAGGTVASIHDANGYNANITNAIGVPTNVQVGNPLYISSIGTNLTGPEADAGQTVEIVVNMSEGVTLNTSQGSPKVTLNDGATATYDAGASNLGTGKLVFDYLIGANDRTPFLDATGFNLNGAVLQASGSNGDLTLPVDPTIYISTTQGPQPLQIGPATVVSVQASQLGQSDTGQTFEIGIGLSEFITVDTTNGTPTLTLSNGATATYDPVTVSLNDDAVIFDYTVSSGQSTSDLEISSVNLNGATVQDLDGSNVDFTLALNTTMNVQIASGSPAPSEPPMLVANTGASVGVGRTLAVTGSELRFTDSVSPDAQETYTITAGLVDGSILKNSAAVTSFTQADIDNGLISYQENGTVVPSDSFSFTVTDAADNSTATEQFAIKVLPPAEMVMRDTSTGGIELYAITNNQYAGFFSLGQVGLEWSVAGLGDFSGNTDETDMLMRDGSNGAFELYDIGSNFQYTGFHSLGQVGPEWQTVGFADFSGNTDETDMLMRDASTGAFELYDISNNNYSGFHSLGQVGPEWTVAGFGDFSGTAGEVDMLMRNSNTGAFELYDISNNTYTGFHSMGQVGLEWSVVGFGDFSGNAGENDMLMRNSNTGGFELYDISNNTYAGFHSMGQVGLEWQVAGLGGFSGNPNETDMLMRNANTGAFELYDISNNNYAGFFPMGQVGTEWQTAAIAANVPNGSGGLVTQFAQSVASFAPAAGPSANAPTADTAAQLGPIMLTPPAAA